eukprot:933085-Pelagomonas_calceolata.AAC.3
MHLGNQGVHIRRRQRLYHAQQLLHGYRAGAKSHAWQVPQAYARGHATSKKWVVAVQQRGLRVGRSGGSGSRRQAAAIAAAAVAAAAAAAAGFAGFAGVPTATVVALMHA